MGSNQVTKRCHWVPQAYLRAFTADPRERKVWRFSKNAGEPELKDIEKVAVRFHLYVPQGSDGRRDDSLEKKLAALEQLFQSPVWMSLRNDYVDLSGEPLRKMVSVLAATMFLRNPNHFTMVRNMHTRFVDLFSELGGPPSYIEINGQELTLDSGEWPGYRDASDDDLIL